MYVADGGSELRDVVELTSLSGRVAIGSRVQGIGEGLVVGQNMERSAFEGVLEMSDR